MPAPALAAVTKLANSAEGRIGNLLKGLARLEDQPRKPITLAEGVGVSAELRTVLAGIGDLLADTVWPDKRRTLTVEEKDHFAEVLRQVKMIKSLVGDAEGSLKASLFNDLDVELEHSGAVSVETPVDDNGFYLVSGEGPGFKRTYSSPTPSADVELLLDLVTEGSLEHADYLAMTSQVRVVDERKFLRYLAKNPAKLSVLRRAIKFSRKASVGLRAA